MITAERYPVGVETPWDQDGIMRAVLHYEGPLPPKPRTDTMMEIRRQLHPQLRHLWSEQETLSELAGYQHVTANGDYAGFAKLEPNGFWSIWPAGHPPMHFHGQTRNEAVCRLSQIGRGADVHDTYQHDTEDLLPGVAVESGVDHVKARFPRQGFGFVPLVTDDLHLMCYLKIVLVSREKRGVLFSRGGDLDNRLKTLVDALRVPDPGQVSGFSPQQGEDPFFVLLEDDALVSDLEIRTEQRLGPPLTGSDRNDVRLTVTAIVRPTKVTDVNRSFLADFF